MFTKSTSDVNEFFFDCPGGVCTSNGSVSIKGNWRMKSRAYSCGVCRWE